MSTSRSSAKKPKKKSTSLRLPALGFYAGVGVMVAIEIVEWPIGLAIAIGHALTSSKSRTAEELGEALEEV